MEERRRKVDVSEPSPRSWRIADGMHETIVDECNNIVANAANNTTAALIVDAVNERAQLESLWARKQIHDPTGSEWHANGKLLYTKDNDFIGEMEHSDDARFVCDAVNNAPLFDILLDDNKELMHDVDRLRAELADKARNYEDVIACHQRTEEHLRDLIKRLITVREKVFWRKDEKTGMTYETCLMDEDEARKTIEEAKAAIKEDKE